MATSALPVPTRTGTLLRVVSNQQLNDSANAAEKARVAAEQDSAPVSQLAQHVRARMTDMRNFRNAEGISERLLSALRTYRGQYDPAVLSAIKQFNGSEVYARVTSTKCRAATALLRDIYLGSDRPWDLDPAFYKPSRWRSNRPAGG